MVCASALPESAAAASWMPYAGLADWPSKDQPVDFDSSAPASHDLPASSTVETQDEVSPPSAELKEVLKLRKKLRDMAKIQERVEAGEAVDPLQQRKLERRSAVAAQLQQAEQALEAAEAAAAEAAEAAAAAAQAQAQGLAQGSEAMGSEAQQQWFTELQAGSEGFGMQMAPLQLLPVPVIVWDAQGQPQQEAAVAWPAFAFCGQEALYAMGSQPDAEDSRTGLSISARRRLRRQRAAERHSGDCQLELVPQPQPLPSPRPACQDAQCADMRSAAPAAALAGHLSEGLLEALEEGGQARAAALERMRGSVARLAFEREGCRAVQTAIQVADTEAVAQLLQELHGRVREAVSSPHANYVLQTVITALPTAMSSFVVKELLGIGAQVARHRYGCRILCRLVEHSSARTDLTYLLREVLAEAGDLCRHSFAHYVVQSILEHLPAWRPKILEALHASLMESACHRCSSHVVESALEHCSELERQGLIHQLLHTRTDSLVTLAENQYGSFVLKSILQVPGSCSKEAWSQLSQSTSQLNSSKYGQRLLQDLGLVTA